MEKFLKAGYIDNGLLIRSEIGTPQGSILSPMLSNIFLHYVLDSWFDKTVKNHVRGFCELVRYADDFVAVVQYADEAQRVEKALKNRFKKYGLEIHPEKSKTFSFGRYERMNADKQNRKANTFNFLGFTHYCDKTRKGYFKVGRKTDRKKFSAYTGEICHLTGAKYTTSQPIISYNPIIYKRQFFVNFYLLFFFIFHLSDCFLSVY